MAHSSFCSRRMAPTRRVMASSFGKMPTTLVRRLTSSVQAFEGVDGVDLGPVLLGEGHVGEDVCFGLVHELGESADRRPQLVGHFAPLGSGGIGVILGEGGGDEV